MSRAGGRLRGDLLALDTDVLVHWAMVGAPHHQAARSLLEGQTREGGRLALAQQTLNEFLHIVTDPRRFENPMPMGVALGLVRELWHSGDVEQILPTAAVQDLVCELMERHRLGRKRILDTALAATLRAASVSALATFNGSDFQIFNFLEVVDPLSRRAG